MPRRDDLKRIVILGSGPIRIGQAAEFDFSGSQACRALRADGYEVILINSNPATIQNDPEMADRIYIEPLLPEVVKRILEIEKPAFPMEETIVAISTPPGEGGIGVIRLSGSQAIPIAQHIFRSRVGLGQRVRYAVGTGSP